MHKLIVFLCGVSKKQNMLRCTWPANPAFVAGHWLVGHTALHGGGNHRPLRSDFPEVLKEFPHCVVSDSQLWVDLSCMQSFCCCAVAAE